MAFLKGRHSDDKPVTTQGLGPVILQGRSHALDGGCALAAETLRWKDPKRE
jgi:hypothetical protein